MHMAGHSTAAVAMVAHANTIATSGKFTNKPQRPLTSVMTRRRRAREKVRGDTIWILDLGFGICELKNLPQRRGGIDNRGGRGERAERGRE